MSAAPADERRCENCGATLPTLARPDRRYCNGACRSAAHTKRQREAKQAASPRPPTELEAAIERAVEEPRLLARVAQAASNDWRAAAWVLSRRWPERWGPPERQATRHVPRELDAADSPFAEVDELAARRRRTP
jgi:hypothetical protein